MFWTDVVDFRLPSPGPPSESSGNVAGSPDIHTGPGRWPSQRDVWESHPDAQKTQKTQKNSGKHRKFSLTYIVSLSMFEMINK